jgi:hypothetical protein
MDRRFIAQIMEAEKDMRTSKPQSNAEVQKSAFDEPNNGQPHKRRRSLRVYIDHIQMDSVLSRARKLIGRPWLTVAIDENTCQMVAYYLSFEMPSYRSCVAVLREIVRHHSRLPDSVVVFNGREFSSGCLDRMAARCEFVIERQPLTVCKFGSILERISDAMRIMVALNVRAVNGRNRHGRPTLAEFDLLLKNNLLRV